MEVSYPGESLVVLKAWPPAGFGTWTTVHQRGDKAVGARGVPVATIR